MPSIHSHARIALAALAAGALALSLSACDVTYESESAIDEGYEEFCWAVKNLGSYYMGYNYDINYDVEESYILAQAQTALHSALATLEETTPPKDITADWAVMTKGTQAYADTVDQIIKAPTSDEQAAQDLDDADRVYLTDTEDSRHHLDANYETHCK